MSASVKDSSHAIFKYPVGSDDEIPLYGEGILVEKVIAGAVN